jgi:hypothetical protein
VTSRFVWEASVHTGRTRNTAPAAPGRLGNEHRNHQAHLDERVRRGYHPRRGGRYDSGEDRSPTPEPPCRRFDPGGSLDRRVNCRRVSQPRWVGARRSTKGGKETGKKGKPAAFVLSYAQVGCACSRGLQASAWERARDLRVGPFSRTANLLVREPWTFLL